MLVGREGWVGAPPMGDLRYRIAALSLPPLKPMEVAMT